MTRRYRRSGLRRWWRRRTRRERRVIAILAIIVIAAMIGGQHQAASAPQSPAPATVAVAPGPGHYTPRTWAQAFLKAIPEPETTCNIAAIETWESVESGGDLGTGQNDDPDVTHNPLNTTRIEPGSTSINSDNVMSYPTWPEGLTANVAAITNGLYGAVLSALQAGGNAQAVATAVAGSHWGTGWFSAGC